MSRDERFNERAATLLARWREALESYLIGDLTAEEFDARFDPIDAELQALEAEL